MLETVKNLEENMARYNSQRDSTDLFPPPTSGGNPATPTTPIEGKQTITLRRRFDGDKAKGMLTQIDCSDKGMTLTIKAGDRTLKLNTTSPDRVQFITFTQDTGSAITCGPIKPPLPVEVTYRSSTDANSKFDGEPIAIEFIKPEKN